MSLKGEMEEYIKPSHDRNVKLRPEILSHLEIDAATKEELLKQKEYSRKNMRSRHQLEVAMPNEDDAGCNINLRSQRCLVDEAIDEVSVGKLKLQVVHN